MCNCGMCLRCLGGLARVAMVSIVVLASGCVSAVQTHARAATVAAVTTASAAELVSDAARLDAEMTCPRSRHEPGSASMRACVAPLRERWAPADAAVASVRAALAFWIETIELAHKAGSGDDLWRPLAQAAARLVREYQALVATLQVLGADVPMLPSVVVVAADAIGGER